MVLTLDGDDMEAGVPDREQVDFEREKVEVIKRRKTKRGPTTHAQTCDVMDGMRMGMKRAPETP